MKENSHVEVSVSVRVQAVPGGLAAWFSAKDKMKKVSEVSEFFFDRHLETNRSSVIEYLKFFDSAKADWYKSKIKVKNTMQHFLFIF